MIANNIINNNRLLGIAMVNGSTPQMIQNLITNNTRGRPLYIGWGDRNGPHQ